MIATFDGEYFLDQRARRPMARIVDGVTVELQWPEIQLRHGTDGDGADVLLLVGPEPDFHWVEFSELVVGLAEQFDVRLVVGLGAFPAPAPHTRPVRLAATVPPASQHLLEQGGPRRRRARGPRGHHLGARARLRGRRHRRDHAVGAGAALRRDTPLPAGLGRAASTASPRSRG